MDLGSQSARNAIREYLCPKAVSQCTQWGSSGSAGTSDQVTMCHCTSKVELQLSARLHHQSSIVAGSDHGFAACVLPLLRPMIPNVPQTLRKHRTIYLKIRGKIMFGTSPSSPRAAETVTASAGVMSTSRARVLSTKTALDSIHVIRTEVKLGYTAFPWVTWI